MCWTALMLSLCGIWLAWPPWAGQLWLWEFLADSKTCIAFTELLEAGSDALLTLNLFLFIMSNNCMAPSFWHRILSILSFARRGLQRYQKGWLNVLTALLSTWWAEVPKPKTGQLWIANTFFIGVFSGLFFSITVKRANDGFVEKWSTKAFSPGCKEMGCMAVARAVGERMHLDCIESNED